MDIEHYIIPAFIVALWVWAFATRSGTTVSREYFLSKEDALTYVEQAEAQGFDCIANASEEGVIEVRCYHKGEMTE